MTVQNHIHSQTPGNQEYTKAKFLTNAWQENKKLTQALAEQGAHYIAKANTPPPPPPASMKPKNVQAMKLPQTPPHSESKNVQTMKLPESKTAYFEALATKVKESARELFSFDWLFNRA